MDYNTNPDTGHVNLTSELGNIVSTEVIDEYTVKINLSTVDAALPSVFTNICGLMLAPSTLGAEDMAIHPVGTGAFKLEEYVEGDHIFLTAYENYWDKGADGQALPYLDRVEIYIMGDDSVRTNNLQTGDIDMVDYVIRLLEKDEMLRAPDFVRNLSLVTVVICAAFSTLLSWILCDSMTRNIQRLNQGMDKVGEGDFSIRVQVHGKDEVSQLTRKFNLFVEHLGNTTQQMVRQATAKKQMELEMMDLRYRSLQTQISPHFICNILASVKGLNSLGRKDEVNRLLVLTSRYLRKNLNNSDIRFVAVRDEVAVVEEYLQIYEQVYRQPIVLNLSLPQELMDCSVPSLLLLPLAENSIQHGGFDRKEAAVIKLRVHQEADRLILYLSDHGNGIPPQVLEGIRDAVASPTRSLPSFGIRSVLMRLRLLYGEEQQFVITSHEGHTTITISLPYRIYGGALPEAGSQ